MFKLKLEGMTCGGCARGIEWAVKKLDQRSELKFDLQQKTVQIETVLSEKDLTDAIAGQGFEVISIKKE